MLVWPMAMIHKLFRAGRERVRGLRVSGNFWLWHKVCMVWKPKSREEGQVMFAKNHYSLGLTLEQRFEKTLAMIWGEPWPKPQRRAKENWSKVKVMHLNVGPLPWPNMTKEPKHELRRMRIKVKAWKPYSYHSPDWHGGEPLPYCHRHELHESSIKGNYAYCPWLDAEVGPKLRQVEERLSAKKRQNVDAVAILRNMGLQSTGVHASAAAKALQKMGF